jgi:hypothetical protein
VSTPSPEPQPYHVVYSVLAQTALYDLCQTAKARGYGADALRALKTIDERLKVYPQFGEPIRNYAALGVTEYRGHVWQITFTYAVDEQRRLVHVAAAPKAMPFGVLAEE